MKITDARAELLKRQQAKDSLLAFTEYTHPDWQTGEHHKTICEKLEAVERGDIKRLIITAPPRHTKSELASRRFPAWYVGRNPAKQIITTTYGDDLSRDFGRDVRGIIDSTRYRNIFSTRLASDARAAGSWRTSEGGVYVSTGIGGPITGRGAHVALIDDYVKNRVDADSKVTRDSIWKWYTSTLYTRLMPGGAIIILATRWHEDDLIGRCLQQDHEDWHLIELPAVTGEGDDRTALWPEWYPLESLDQIKATLPSRDWNALYQQDPQPETGSYFQRDWFQRYKSAPEVQTYITTDFAVTADGGDYTELAVWGVDGNDNLFALDWWHGQQSADVWIDALIGLCERWEPHTVWGESGVIRRAMEPFITRRCRERGSYFHLDWITRTADKAAMAQSFRGRCSMRKVYFPELPWADRVINQCVGFPTAEHDDAVDACALMGMALDTAFGASAPYREPDKPAVDRWFRLFRKAEESNFNWKTS